MDFKSNLNKLHYLLTEKFNNVSIEELYSKELGNYVKISIKENLQCDVIITKKELENYNLNWKYSANPLNEKSEWVDRNSSIENFTNVIKDILDKKRFSSDYLKNI